MKKILVLTAALTYSLTLLGQLDFAPIGAVWYEKLYCLGSGNVPPPEYSQFTVTKDSIIQGKYCTRILASDWSCDNNNNSPWMYVHQDNGKVYRWEHGTSSFHLVLDFTKEAGESWRIPFCGDSVTIIVIDRNGPHRVVSVVHDSDPIWNFDMLDLYEGFGGTLANRLLLNLHLILVPKPPCLYASVCFEYPNLGIIYSDGACTVSAGVLEDREEGFNIHPNPSSDYLNFQMHSARPSQGGAFRILSASGQVLREFAARDAEATYILPVWEWAAGVYFLQYMESGEVLATERVVVAR